MVILIFLLFLNTAYAEGDFWRNKEKESQGWTVIEQDFSHIIYQAPNKELWTKCHSCMRFCRLKDAHKVTIDRRKEIKARLDWEIRHNNLPLWKKIYERITNKWIEEPPIIVMNPGKDGIYEIADYEELYYCDRCFDPNW